jgi:hypothetical protein
MHLSDGGAESLIRSDTGSARATGRAGAMRNARAAGGRAGAAAPPKRTTAPAVKQVSERPGAGAFATGGDAGARRRRTRSDIKAGLPWPTRAQAAVRARHDRRSRPLRSAAARPATRARGDRDGDRPRPTASNGAGALRRPRLPANLDLGAKRGPDRSPRARADMEIAVLPAMPARARRVAAALAAQLERRLHPTRAAARPPLPQLRRNTTNRRTRQMAPRPRRRAIRPNALLAPPAPTRAMLRH